VVVDLHNMMVKVRVDIVTDGDMQLISQLDAGRERTFF
jgi:hypothetical protein